MFRLAAEHDNVRAVLSFSPGEHLGGGERVRGYASRVSVPIFATSAPGAEVRETERILDQTDAALVTHYIPAKGVHGSSSLRADRNPAGHSEYWRAVVTFLEGFAAAGPSESAPQGRQTRPDAVPESAPAP